MLKGNFEDIKNSIIQHRKESVVKKIAKKSIGKSIYTQHGHMGLSKAQTDEYEYADRNELIWVFDDPHIGNAKVY